MRARMRVLVCPIYETVLLRVNVRVASVFTAINGHSHKQL